MKSTTIVIIIALIGLALFGAYALNIIPGLNNPLGDEVKDDAESISDSCSCDHSDIEIHAVLEAITNKTLSYPILVQYIDNLDMVMCHIDDTNYAGIINIYKDKYQDEGLILYDTQDYGSGTWTARVGLWYTPDYNEIRTVTGISGVAVNSIFGHDTIFLLASGDPSEWTSFWTWINS